MKSHLRQLVRKWDTLNNDFTDDNHKAIIDEFEKIITENPSIAFDIELARKTSQMYETYELHTEIEQAKTTKISEFLQTTCEFAKLEIRGAKITSKTKVCFIGGGYYPESVMTYNISDCCITCIDRDIKAIVSAKKHFSNCKYFHKNAFDMNYSNYDVVIIAAFIKNKSELIEYICKTAKKNSKIICRNTKGSIRYMHEPITYTPKTVKKINEFKTNSSMMHAVLFQVI